MAGKVRAAHCKQTDTKQQNDGEQQTNSVGFVLHRIHQDASKRMKRVRAAPRTHKHMG